MKKLFLVTVGLLIATPALADIPNDGKGVRKNGYCVIETQVAGHTAYYIELCSESNVTCGTGWGTPCTITGEVGEPSRYLPWDAPKEEPQPPRQKPQERPRR